LKGQVLGNRFEVESWLGSGGMGTVYRAIDRVAHGAAVVKVIHPSLVSQSGPGAALSVLKEAVALGRVNERVPPTPHVVRLLDTGTIRVDNSGESLELPWIAVEFVD